MVHYQLGALQKLANNLPAAVSEFERSRELGPRMAAPCTFSYTASTGRWTATEDAAAELQKFQDLKKQQEGAAVPEDMDWSFYSEIYDAPPSPAASPPSPAVYREEKLAAGFTGDTAGTAALLADGVHPSLIVWGGGRATLFRNGAKAVPDSGLEELKDVVSVAVGDFDNDGLPDLCVITSQGALLYRNAAGHFRLQAELARGSFRKAVWVDYDHDYDADVLLVGDDLRLLRNDGEAGFSDESKRFPFVPGKALDAVRFDREPDTQGFDLAVSYATRAGVLYRDGLGGTYTAQDLPELPAGAFGLVAGDVNNDGRTDVAARLPEGQRLLLLNREAAFQAAPAPKPTEYPFAQLVDFAGRGRERPRLHRRRRRSLHGPRCHPRLRQLDKDRAHRRQECQARQRRADRSQGRNGLSQDRLPGCAGISSLWALAPRWTPCASPGPTRPDPKRNAKCNEIASRPSRKRRVFPDPAP